MFRAVAVVSTRTISHGQELYLDYLKEQRVCPEGLEYVPEWLLEPPPESKYLQKKQMVTKVPFLIKLIQNA